jgi:hypothetical protein
VKPVPRAKPGRSNAKRVVRAHGGEIWSKSELGKGATFFSRCRRDTSYKFQAPSSNIQRSTKLQTSIKLATRDWCLVFGISLELGCWCLELLKVRMKNLGRRRQAF